jgi:hypothetical protein
MIPEQSTLNTLGLIFIVTMCFFILILPRRYAIAPLIVITCYMTLGEDVLVNGFHFTMFRILALVGWVRILSRGEIRNFKINPIDKLFVCWVIANATCDVILWGTYAEFVNRLGFAYNALGLYFMFRILIRDLDDIKRTYRIVAVLIIPLGFFMLAEKITGHNAFAVFGGVDAITRVREGSLRCQGPFAHPILAGSFGATLCPLLFALWWQGARNRVIAVLGILSAITITVTSASSGPAFALMFGILALIMWNWRQHLRKLRWAIAITLIGLQMVMKAPVWFLLGRVSLFSGSTGFHRAYIIDHFIGHFSEWWLVGVKDTAHWGALMADVTNEYVFQGITGGLLTLVLFIWIIVRCFRGVGLTVRGMKDAPFADQISVWVLGAALLTHAVNYISIDYFDQNVVNWYMLLAMISTVSGSYLLAKRGVLLRFSNQAPALPAPATLQPSTKIPAAVRTSNQLSRPWFLTNHRFGTKRDDNDSRETLRSNQSRFAGWRTDRNE